jgi:carbamoyltransferase
MRILGISCHYHDAAAALLVDGQLVAAASEERFTRLKHDHAYPEQAIAFCLAEAGLSASDLDYAVFYEKPLRKFERILQTVLAGWPFTWGVFRESMVAWFNEKLWIKSEIAGKLGLPAERLLFCDHHLSHAASAFYCSPYDEAALLTCDGVGEWQTTTIGRATADWDGSGKNAIELLGEIRFPHSLGLLYSAFTAYLGFRVNSGEYKVMGMAPYGQPIYADKVWQLVELDDAGGFRLNMDYFSFHRSTERTYNASFVALFGPERKHESDFFTTDTDPERAARDPEKAERNQHYADIAASIQEVTEEMVLAMARQAHALSGSKRLCMAGGVALNSVANGRILAETPFEELYIQPAAGDAGGALGAALWAWHEVLGKPRSFVMEHAYWGQEYAEAEVLAVLDGYGIHYEILPDDADFFGRLVDTLEAGRIIGWFQGRFEWGPRALGKRSILADPRRDEMKEIVNTKIKFREPFRPFAPVVIAERARDYFELPPAVMAADGSGEMPCYPAEFMLLVSDIPEARQAEIPAVTHVNGSGRLQVVRRETNADYYDLIAAFGERTGTPVLLNTSFNLRGEPIVSTPAEALATFAHSDIDSLVLGRVLVEKATALADGGRLDAIVPAPRTVMD